MTFWVNQGYSWAGSDLGADRKTELVVYVVLAAFSVLLLALAVGVIYRRCSRGKLTLANVIALDLQDPEFLTSLTKNAERHTSTSSDGSDGVFVMVYLPPPYEETLTKITRAASLSSSKDVESIKIEDLEAKLCPELRSGGRYVWRGAPSDLHWSLRLSDFTVWKLTCLNFLFKLPPVLFQHVLLVL